MYYITTFVFLFLSTLTALCQNIGIDVPNPTEKLEVGGIIFTNSGGIKFPDSTVQTTAALSSFFEESAMQRQYILMQLDIGSNIPGPDSAINIPNGIKVIDFSFQNTNDGSNIIINRFQLAKQIDESSIPILQAFHEGAMIDEMILHFLTADSQGILTEYYSITLEGGLFTSVEQSIVFTGNGWSHIETLDLVYDAVSFEHLSPNLEYGFSFIH